MSSPKVSVPDTLSIKEKIAKVPGSPSIKERLADLQAKATVALPTRPLSISLSQSTSPSVSSRVESLSNKLSKEIDSSVDTTKKFKETEWKEDLKSRSKENLKSRSVEQFSSNRETLEPETAPQISNVASESSINKEFVETASLSIDPSKFSKTEKSPEATPAYSVDKSVSVIVKQTSDNINKFSLGSKDNGKFSNVNKTAPEKFVQSGKSSIASSFTLESKANSTVKDNKIAHENVNNQGEMPHQKKVAARSNAQEEAQTDFSGIRNAIKPVTTIQLDEKLQMLRCVNSIQYSDSVLNIFSFDRYDIHQDIKSILKEQMRQFAIAKVGFPRNTILVYFYLYLNYPLVYLRRI